MGQHGFLVVAHHRDGQLTRGHTPDFRPGRPTFAVTTESGMSLRILVEDLKAIFFVRSLSGDPDHVQDNAFDEEPRVGRRVWVVFQDGEQLAGRAPSVNLTNQGFFLFPNDSDSNLERAWVVIKSTREIFYDADALAAAARYDAPAGPRDSGAASPENWGEIVGSPEESPVESPDDPPEPPAEVRPASSPPQPPGSPEPADEKPRKKAPRDSGIFLGDW